MSKVCTKKLFSIEIIHHALQIKSKYTGVYTGAISFADCLAK